MHQLLLRHRQVEQRVAAGRRLAQPRADGDDQVAGLQPLAQRRADADAEIAGIVRMAVVEQVLVAERGADRQVVGLDEGTDVGAGLGGPAAAAHDHHRLLGRGQQLAQRRHVLGRRRAARDLVGAGVGHLDLVDQHVLGQRDHDRAGPAVQRGVKCLADQLGDAPRILDLDHPLGHLAEHAAVVDLLEGLAVGRLARHLADQQDHGRRILEAGMQSDAGIGGTRTARDEGDAGLAGELAVGLGHVGRPAFLAADDEAHGVALGVERVERRQVAFARHAEDRIGAVNAQLVDQDLSAAAARMRARHDFPLLRG